SVVRINIEREHVNGGFVHYDDIQRHANSSEQNATIGCNIRNYDVPALSDSFKQKYLKLRERTYNETIVILTPLRDTAKFLEHFGNILNTLTYPHDLISVFFVEEGSSDNTFESAKALTHQLNSSFKESQVHKLNFTGNPIRREDRHRQFLHVSTDVMAVACLMERHGRPTNYDFNTRRFGDEKCRDLPLPFLRDEGRVVKVDIVGTSVLMVRSEVHRKIRFPEVTEPGGRLESEGVVRINIEREHVNGGFVHYDDIQRHANSSEQNATIGCNIRNYDVPALSDSFKQKYLKLRERTYNETIVILTPLRDTAKFLEHFGNILNTLTYPHDLISVFFVEEGSSDNTFESAKALTHQLNSSFKESQVHKLNFTGNPIRREDRHRQFLHVSTDVMAVACLIERHGRTTNYDFNTLRFGDEKCRNLPLPFLRDEGRVVKVDIVGTSVLMVRSEVHRKIRFPEVTEPGGRLESEGFALNAKKVGVVRINIEREHVNGGFVHYDDIQRDEISSEQNATVIGCNFCRYDVPAVSNDYKQKYLKLREREYNETIVILTPLRDTAKFLEHFGTMLNTLSYPHDLISVFFAEEGSSDNTFESAKALTLQLNKGTGKQA
ncbi:hypothetical protein MAR_013315, partial [Mya arenaria]